MDVCGRLPLTHEACRTPQGRNNQRVIDNQDAERFYLTSKHTCCALCMLWHTKLDCLLWVDRLVCKPQSLDYTHWICLGKKGPSGFHMTVRNNSDWLETKSYQHCSDQQLAEGLVSYWRQQSSLWSARNTSRKRRCTQELTWNQSIWVIPGSLSSGCFSIPRCTCGSRLSDDDWVRISCDVTDSDCQWARKKLCTSIFRRGEEAMQHIK